MVNLPTFRQLEHLVLLADHGHFGRAAKACHVTQSTLSASIKALEKILQASLVDRTKRRVLLTPLGLDIVERARRILLEGKELVETARAESEPLNGTLRMGVISTVGPFLLPKILPRLRRAYPALKLYLVEDLTARLIEGLHAGRTRCRLARSALRLWEQRAAGTVSGSLQSGAAEESSARGREGGRPRTTAVRGIAAPHRGALSARARARSMPAGRKAAVGAGEATSLHTLVQMVDNGLGITLLPQLAIDGGILSGTALTVLPTTGEPPSREIGLVWRRGTGRQREFELLASVLTQLVEERPRP